MLRIGDALEAGIVVRQRSRVARSLNVVLAGHGIHAGAFAPQVAGHERQIAQALYIVDAADMFGNPDGVIDCAAFGPAVPERRLLNVVGIAFADFGCPLRGEAFDMLQEILAVRGCVRR